MNGAYAFLLPSTLVLLGAGFWIIWRVWRSRAALFWGYAYLFWALCQALQVAGRHLHKVDLLAQTLFLLSIFFQMHGLQDYVGEPRARFRSRLLICFVAIGVTDWLLLIPHTGQVVLSVRLAMRLALTGIALAVMRRHLSHALSKMLFAVVVIMTIAIMIVAIGMIDISVRNSQQTGFLLFGQIVGNIVAIVFAFTAFSCVIFDITQRYKYEALYDPLSGLPNRRHFDAFYRRKWNRAANTHQPLSLLMIDVDEFKTFNDTYGHLAGDRCLVRVADIIRTSMRQRDLCARFGGEEFVALLPGTPTAGAEVVARNICCAVRLEAIPNKNSPIGIVTVSIGVATVVPSGPNNGCLLETADIGLYKAKNNGRNRVEVMAGL